MLSLAESRAGNSELRPRSDSWSAAFTGRIDRRLTLVYISLFILVFSLGGVSLYLLASHLIKSANISRQSEQIHIIEQIDRRLQDFISRTELAHLQGMAIPVSFIETSLRDFDSFLTRYRNAGGTASQVQKLEQMIADAERIATAMRNETGRGNIGVNTH